MRTCRLSIHGFTSAPVRLAVVFTLTFGAACSRSPAGPTLGSDLTAARPADIVLEGPLSVAPGATSQFTLIAYRADGTRYDATRDAMWTSSHPAHATVFGGRATGIAAGETFISAHLNGLGRSAALIVVPAGTFRVTGRVDEAGVSVDVPGVRIEVTGGGAAGLVAMTDDWGNYRIHGVWGSTRIVATKAGYGTDVRDVVVSSHQAIDFRLGAGAPVPAVEGRYTLTLGASASCRNRLPADLRSRTYTGQVARSKGRELWVSLSGATFARSDGFYGRIEPGSVTFRIIDDPWDLGFVSFAEQIDSTQLRFRGVVAATLHDGAIVGTLDGHFDAYAAAQYTMCLASDHLFELRRR